MKNKTRKFIEFICWFILFLPAFGTFFYDPIFSYFWLFIFTFFYIKKIRVKSKYVLYVIFILYIFFMIFPPYHVFIRPMLIGTWVSLSDTVSNVVQIKLLEPLKNIIQIGIFSVLFGISLIFLSQNKDKEE